MIHLILWACSCAAARAEVAGPCEDALARPTVTWQLNVDPENRARFDEVVMNIGRLLVGPEHDLRPRRVVVRLDHTLGLRQGFFLAPRSKLVLPVPTPESWWRTRAVWAHEYAHAVIADILRARGGVWTRFYEFMANQGHPAWAWYVPEYRRLAAVLAIYEESFADLLAMLESRSPVAVDRFRLFDELVRATDLPEAILREDPHYALMHFTNDLYRRFDRKPAASWPARLKDVVDALVTVVEDHAAGTEERVDAARAARLFGAEIARRWALDLRE